MGWTKRQLIEAAMEEIGLASYAFDAQPEELQSALKRLDSMMTFWNRQGVRIGYPVSSNPSDSDLDTDTDVTDMAIEAIITGLALRIAPSYGKQVSLETKQNAKASYHALLAQSAKPPEQQVTRLPRGAGAKYWRTVDDPFLADPSDNLDAGPDSELEFE